MLVLESKEDPLFIEFMREAGREGAKAALNAKETFNWITEEKAIELLGVGAAQLKNYRRDKTIGFSQPSKKVILYNLPSIELWLNKNEIKARK